jgi:chaperone modulatory protein CbpM
MDDKTVIAGVLMDGSASLTFVEVCQTCHISKDDLLNLIEHGFLEQQALLSQQINEDALAKIQSACRLQEDLGLNIPGVVLAMELLEELVQVREELNILQRHLKSSQDDVGSD